MFIDQPYRQYYHRVDSHPLVSQFLKGFFQLRPPLLHYTETWDVSKFKSLGSNRLLSTKMLSFKLAMLLSLTVPSRCSELAARDLRFRRVYPEGVVHNLAAVLKSGFHPRFNEEPDLCPCACLEEYEGCTSIYRVSPADQANLLFLSLIRPFKPVSSSTIAHWVKEVLSLSGIDTTKFKAHLTCGASATAAADRGISISEILQLGDWSLESTFQKFYYLPQFNTSGGRAILSSGMDQNGNL